MLSSSNRMKASKFSAENLNKSGEKAADADSKVEVLEWHEHMENAGDLSENSPMIPEKQPEEVIVDLDGLENGVLPCVLELR